MRRQNRQVLLFIDNARSHLFNNNLLRNVHVKFLTPNMTFCIQPLDAGVIKAFKAHYHQLFILKAFIQYENNVQDIYKINQLEAI